MPNTLLFLGLDNNDSYICVIYVCLVHTHVATYEHIVSNESLARAKFHTSLNFVHRYRQILATPNFHHL